MITATFFRDKQRYCGVSVSGHAGFADAGQDVICASVSASVQMTANLLTEIYHIPADVTVTETCISISVETIQDSNADLLLQGFHLQLQLLKEEAPDCICIRISSNKMKHTEV